MNRQSGELLHSSAGQVIITANWELIEGNLHSELKNHIDIESKKVESHQKIWNILVNAGKGRVTRVVQQADRVITDIAKSNVVHADLNMFVCTKSSTDRLWF